MTRRAVIALWLAAGLWGLSAVDGRAVVVDQLLAVVNGKTIAVSDLVRHRWLFAPNLPPGQLLQRLIDHIIVLEEASRFDTAPPDPVAVRGAVQELAQAFETEERWRGMLQRARLTPDDIEKLMADQLRVEAFLIQRVDLFVFVSPADVRAAYDDEAKRFADQTYDEVEPVIERELLHRKIADKRQDYIGRLRTKAAIRQLADAPADLPPRPSP
jgi:hypothetical protein